MGSFQIKLLGGQVMTRRHPRDEFAGAISFLILLAVTYLRNPNIVSETEEFVRDFKPVQVSQNFWWLAPSSNHPILYSAASQFCYIFGLVQVVVLGLLFVRASSNRQRTRTFSDVIFWLGAGYMFGILSSGSFPWISFLGALIILVGICIVVRSTILLLVRQSHQ
jgi:hypothetical protein